MTRWWLRVLSMAHPSAGSLTGILLLGFAGIAIEVVKPWPVKLVVDSLLANKPLPPPAQWLSHLPAASSPAGLLAWLAALTLIVYLAGWLANMVQAYLQSGTGARSTYRVGATVFEHLQRLSLDYHARMSKGDLVKRAVEDSRCGRDLVIGVAVPLVTSLVLLLTMFAVLWSLEPVLSLWALLVAPLHLLAIWGFEGKMTDYSYREMVAQGALMAGAERTLSVLPLVQAYGREDEEDRRFGVLSRRSGEAYFHNMLSQMQFGLTTGAVSALGRAAILGLGGSFVLAGRMTVGDLIVFLSYLLALYSPLDTLAGLARSFSTAAAGAKRIFEVMDVEPRPQEPPGAVEFARSREGQGVSVKFDHVTFGYESRRPVLEDFTLDIAAGETVAIAGPSGAGKSTLVGMLLRFHDPHRGQVLVGGQDIRNLTLGGLRENISVVLQDPFLLPVSVAENIAYGNPGANADEIVQAACAAGAHDFIEHLPEGYDTRVGEKGATLSGGERQRIAIARAILKKAPLMILDEPTAALDAETESVLLDALRNLKRGRTILLIAHRQSVLRHADRVVTLDQGRSIQEALA